MNQGPGPSDGLWVRLYSGLARLLPRGFRDRYLVETVDDFREMSTSAASSGRLAGTAAVVVGLLDLLRRIPAEHIREYRGRRGMQRGSNRPRRGQDRGGVEGMMSVLKELRLAARTLMRRPGYTSVAVLTLALGIGATVAIFTVVNAVLLQPLPYPDSGDLVAVNHHAPGLDLPDLNNSPGTVQLYRAHSRSFSGFSVYGSESRNLLLGDHAERVQIGAVTPDIFELLMVRPAMGRPFNTEDALEGAARVALLSHAAWRGRFGSDSEVLGRTIDLDGQVTEVIGVMPAGFAFPSPEIVALVPMYVDPAGPFGEFGMRALARLAPGVTLEAAQQEVTDLQTRIPEIDSEIELAFLEQAGWSASVVRFRDEIVGDIESALWVVLGTVGFVLLIACANVANLFLVRAEARQKELAVRAALGAGRTRLAGGYLAESLLLAAGGGLAGVALAAVGVRALIAGGPAELPRLHEVSIDWTVLTFAFAVSALAGLTFGALPIFRYLGRSFARVLRDGGRGSTEGRERHRTRNVLVAAQLALALVLLVGSGLMLRSFKELRAVDSGIVTEGVLTVAVSVGDGADSEARAAFYGEVLEGVGALPGVEVAGAATSVPVLPEGINGGSFTIESRPRDDAELPSVAMYDAVGAGYFEALGIPIVEGRTAARADHEEGRRVVWVNESFASSYLDGNALGERVRWSEEEPWLDIVGVVGNVRSFGLVEDIRPQAYMPMYVDSMSRQETQRMILVLKASGNITALTSAVRRVVADVNPRAPLTDARTMEEVVAASMADTSFTMVLLGIAALVAMLLGAVGIYGVIAYVVSQRTREIGIRMALGARSEDVQGLVVRQGLAVTVPGVLLGIIAALALTRLMASLLYGVSTTDPLTFILVPVVLTGVSLVASYLPARRACRIDPTEALRAE